MCLVALLRGRPDAPLVIAANRDELHARPAVAMAVLGEDPRVRGGRDLVAGGTWLAVGDHGVVVALTNRPGPRDPGRRTRGELPIRGARAPSARDAAEALAEAVRRGEHGRCWLFAADRTDAFWIDATGDGPPGPHAITSSLEAFENVAPFAPSPKRARVMAALAPLVDAPLEALPGQLHRALSAHDARPGESATRATCVHAGPYGTRSQTIVILPRAGAPRIWVAAGPPCTTTLVPQV